MQNTQTLIAYRGHIVSHASFCDRFEEFLIKKYELPRLSAAAQGARSMREDLLDYLASMEKPVAQNV